jgi:hypothetical protein
MSFIPDPRKSNSRVYHLPRPHCVSTYLCLKRFTLNQRKTNVLDKRAAHISELRI